MNYVKTIEYDIAVAGGGVFLKLPPGRRIDRIADLLPAHRRRGNMKIFFPPGLFHQILQNILTHWRSADIAMAQEKYLNHKNLPINNVIARLRSSRSNLLQLVCIVSHMTAGVNPRPIATTGNP